MGTSKIRVHMSWVIFTLVVVYILGAVASPLLIVNGYTDLGEGIYHIYGYLCHQDGDRTVHLYGEPMAFCIRDLAVYLFMAITQLYVLINTDVKNSTTRLKLMIALMLPMILDLSLQWVLVSFTNLSPTLDIYMESWIKRIITGSMFGIGFGYLVSVSILKGETFVYNE